MLPLYLVLAIVFGGVDPLFRTPIPVWNPLQWDATVFLDVLAETFNPDGLFGAALVRTIVYVLTASVLCVLIAFPIAYYVARLAGRRRGLLLALLIAPFWISYMMRMLAWVNLLGARRPGQPDDQPRRAAGRGAELAERQRSWWSCWAWSTATSRT